MHTKNATRKLFYFLPESTRWIILIAKGLDSTKHIAMAIFDKSKLYLWKCRHTFHSIHVQVPFTAVCILSMQWPCRQGGIGIASPSGQVAGYRLLYTYRQTVAMLLTITGSAMQSKWRPHIFFTFTFIYTIWGIGHTAFLPIPYSNKCNMRI